LYKRLSERYGLLAEEFRSATDMIEDLVCSLDTLEEKRFKRLFGIDPPIQTRTRIVNTLNVMKESQPFSSLSSKESNLLNMLKHAIERGNPDLAKSGLHQLADEIEVLEGSLRTQSKRTQLSFVISAIGVVLTLFFGAISFVQLAKS
jgi:hypothetical protein